MVVMVRYAQPWMPVLVAVLLIAPWPILALGIQPARRPEIVAVPASGPDLSARVSPVFSRARYYLIVNLRSGELRALSNPYRKAQHAAGLRGAYLLLQQRIGSALAASVGPEPYNNLTARGVRVYGGASGTVREAIDQLTAGKLTRLSAPSVPIHYGLQRRHGLQPTPQRRTPLPTSPARPAALPSGSASAVPIERL